MKNNIFLIVMLFFSFTYSQVGIGTNDPKATLHIEPSNASSPSGKDGILIPRVNDFPVAQSKGQIVFLQGHATLETGFYYFDGIDWNSFIVNGFDRFEDSSIYVFTGVGYSGTGGTGERNVFFNQFKAYDPTGFSLSGNSITIGKSGKYLVSFDSSIKKANNANRNTFTYRIKRGTSTLLTSKSSTNNEETTAVSSTFSGLLDLNTGDVLNVTVQKESETSTSDLYTGYGTNALTLRYLRN